MLAAHQRLVRRTDFTRALSWGARIARPDLVVNLYVPQENPLVGQGPRVGFVVSKAVGNAVVRHRVSRRLRAAAAPVLPRLHDNSLLVVRALPRAADRSSAELSASIGAALDKLAARGLVDQP